MHFYAQRILFIAIVILVGACRSTDPSTMDGSPAPPNTPSCTGGWCGGHGDH